MRHMITLLAFSSLLLSAQLCALWIPQTQEAPQGAAALLASQAFAEPAQSYFTMGNGSEHLAAQAEQGSVVQFPIRLKMVPGYDSIGMNLSFGSRPDLSDLPREHTYQYAVPKINAWVKPYHAEANAKNATTNIVTITVDSDVKPGTYAIDIMGDGALKGKNSDEYVPITKTVGTIMLDVMPRDSKIKMSIGDRTVHMGSFCISFDDTSQSCSYGPTYEEYPITIHSESKTRISLKAINVPPGAWLKFVPDTIMPDQGNATVKMLLAGYEMPFLSSSDSTPLEITAESQGEHVSGFIPIIKNRDIAVIKKAEPIKLEGDIQPNTSGSNFNTYGVVYDPESQKKSIDIRLQVLGILDGNTIQPMPLWLAVDSPSSLTLNATEPYFFAIKATTSSAPLGVHNVAIKETVDGQEFVQSVAVRISAPVYTGPAHVNIQTGPSSFFGTNPVFGMSIVLACVCGSIATAVILKSRSQRSRAHGKNIA